MLSTVALATVLVSCIPTTQSIAEDGDRRASELRAEIETEWEQLKSSWDKEISELSQREAREIAYIRCEKQIPDEALCGLIAQTYLTNAYQESFVQSECSAVSASASEDYCEQLLTSRFLQTLYDRYGVDPNEVCADGGCTSFVAIELKVLQKHNDRVGEKYGTLMQQVNATYSARGEALIARLQAESAANDRRTADAIDDARRRRAQVVQALQGMSQSFSNAPGASGPPAAYPSGGPAQSAAASGCSSDYECGYGNVCAKDSGAFRGVCAKAVDPYGTPTFTPPSSESIGPGTGQCSFDTDCPIGFRCVKTAGGLRGNCLK